jgi:hypothetical protein
MPKIQVYKGNNAMIPISVAKKSNAYQCPWTKKLYADKRGYVKHLKNLRETRMHYRARNIITEKTKKELWQQSSFEDVIQWLKNHPEFLFNQFLSKSYSEDKSYFEKYRDSFLFEITYLNLTWSDRCSNTHSKPHNGVTNWGGNVILEDGSPAPRGYAGWTGNIEFKINCNMNRGSDVLSSLRINTGSGGSRSNNGFGYGVTFFEDDWPEIKKSRKTQCIEDAINDVPSNNKFTYGKADYFSW